MKTSLIPQSEMANNQNNDSPNHQPWLTPILRFFAPRLFFSLLFFILSVLFSQAQEKQLTTDSRILLRQAMLDVDRMSYDKAITKLLDLRSQTSENANIDYLLGTCYLYSKRILTFEKAVFYLSNASKNISSEYSDWDLEETSAPTDVLYHLGKAQEKLGHYEQAAVAFEDYLVILSEDALIKRSKMYSLIEKMANDFQMAAEIMRTDNAEGVNLAQHK